MPPHTGDKELPGSGPYGIKFVQTGKYAIVESAITEGPGIIQSSGSNVAPIKWQITKINDSGVYTIQSTSGSHFFARAQSGGEDISGDRVLLGSESFQWIIKVVGTENQYRVHIHHPNAGSPLVWNFANADPGTNVTLTDTTTTSAEWILEK